MSDLREKRELNRGFGDGMSRAFELAATPIVFGLLGWGLDSLVGTSPLFAVGFAVFAVIGQFVRLWYGYDAEMKAHEANGLWNRTRSAAPADPAPTDATSAPVDLWSARREQSA